MSKTTNLNNEEDSRRSYVIRPMDFLAGTSVDTVDTDLQLIICPLICKRGADRKSKQLSEKLY